MTRAQLDQIQELHRKCTKAGAEFALSKDADFEVYAAKTEAANRAEIAFRDHLESMVMDAEDATS